MNSVVRIDIGVVFLLSLYLTHEALGESPKEIFNAINEEYHGFYKDNDVSRADRILALAKRSVEVDPKAAHSQTYDSLFWAGESCRLIASVSNEKRSRRFYILAAKFNLLAFDALYAHGHGGKTFQGITLPERVNSLEKTYYRDPGQ